LAEESDGTQLNCDQLASEKNFEETCDDGQRGSKSIQRESSPRITHEKEDKSNAKEGGIISNPVFDVMGKTCRPLQCGIKLHLPTPGVAKNKTGTTGD